MATSSISSSGSGPSPKPSAGTSPQTSFLRRTFRAIVVHRDFRIMWMGACTSSIGTWMQNMAQAWVVLQLSGSAFWLGFDAFLGQLPIVLFSLIGGVVADRVERRKLLLGSQFVQMASAAMLALLFALGVAQIWHILVLSFVTGFAQSFGGPAYQALIPTLVGEDDVPNAIAMNSIQFNLARVIGPMLGGLALTKLGASWCFSLNALSFVAVIISLLVIRTRFIPERTGHTMFESFKQGIAFIHRQEAMISLIVLAFSMTVLAFPIVVFLPVFAKNVFHSGADLYTLLLCCSGAGAVAGGVAVAYMGRFRRQGRAALMLIVALGAILAVFALSTSLVLSAVMIFISGAALIAAFATISSLVQLITADVMRGRVMSVYNVAFRGGMPVGSLIVGSLVPRFTAPVVLAWDGVLLSLLGVYFFVSRRRLASI